MRAVVQRCLSARVEVAGEVVGEVGAGLCAFVGAGKGDGEAEARFMVEKILNLRVFEDDAGKMGRSLLDTGGGLLVVSQFTLYGDVRKGRRPSFDAALEPEAAERLIGRLVELARARCSKVETGRFRADMRVFVENDGPVTILIDSARAFLHARRVVSDDPFETLWRLTLEAWQEPEAHQAFLEQARSSGRLAEAAARYRSLSGDPDLGPEARKRLSAITLLAMQSLEAHRSKPVTVRPSVAFVLSLPLLILAAYALLRALSR